jgi:predicted RNA polymerase sigma factor
MIYDLLAEAAPGSVVEVNRAVAHGRAFTPKAGLAVLEKVDTEELRDSPLLPSVRGDLLERAGQHAGAAEAFVEAAAHTRNESERALLQRRAAENLERV